MPLLEYATNDNNISQVVDSSHPLPTSSVSSTAANPNSVKTGQVKIAVTGTAVQLSSTSIPLSNGLIVKSRIDNNANRQTVGNSTVTNVVDGSGNGYILEPGEAASFGVNNVTAVYVNGTVGDIFSWEGN